MPESFGRGLELRSTKFPQKEILKQSIDVDKLNVQKSLKVGRFPWGVVISPES